MKIGILTYHRANNFGAFLQAYGLCSRLNQEDDIDAEIIDFHMQKEIAQFDETKKSLFFKFLKYRNYKFLKKRHKVFNDCIKYHRLSSEYLHSDNIEDFKNFVNGKYDIIIVGSDEIWKLDGYRGFPTPYWLPGVLNCTKVSYAASSRTDLKCISSEKIETVKKFLNDFEIISVRDEITYNQFLKILPKEKKIYVNADPSFIFDYKKNEEKGRQLLINRGNLNESKRIVVVMTDDEITADIIKKQLGKKYQLVSVYSWHYGYKNIADLSPFEWIDAIAGADFVISSFFHGICFSIINETPFLAIGTSYDKDSKVIDILKRTENNNRYISLNELRDNKSLLIDKVRSLQNKPSGRNYIKKARSEFENYVDLIRKIYNNK